MYKLSVVIPVYNEEANIQPLVERLFEALNNLNFQIVFVDDGSTDETAKKIKALNNKKIQLVVFRKNYGQSLAMAAGIRLAEGEYIATMDGDLQNDPEDIPRMLKIAEQEGWDIVAGYRKNRQDNFWFRILPSRIGNYIIRKTTGVHLKDYGCTLKIFRAETAKELELHGELHRFIPVLAALEGASITQTEVNHFPRKAGVSKYGMNRTFRVFSDLLLILFLKKYLLKPMHLFGTTGVVIFMTGVVINLYFLGIKLLGHDIWGKPLLILGLLCVIGGIQLITIGLFAELLMRTYFETRNKPPYRIREIFTGEN